MRTIYTIGYSNYDIDAFLNVIKKYNISCVIDVRSKPYSKYFSNYNKDVLSRVLDRNTIYYRNYSEEFGAQQHDGKFYSEEGFLDFQKFVKSEKFQEGFKKIELGMGKGFVFALMCAESDPINCHRNIMVAKEFFEHGYNVVNILKNSKIETQEELEKRLVNLYFKENQNFLFPEENLSFQDKIKIAYRKRNQAIGFKGDDAE